MSDRRFNRQSPVDGRRRHLRSGDERLRAVVLLALSAIIAGFGLSLGLLEIVWSDPTAGWPTAAVGLLFVFLIVDWTRRRDTSMLAISAGLVISLLFVYFLVQGGAGRAGPVWAVLFPFFLPYLYGMRRGTLVNLAYFFAAGAIFFWLGPRLVHVDYPWLFKLNTLAAILASMLLGTLAEYARSEALWERDAAIAALERAARTDQLTHLPNRRHILEELTYAFKARARFDEPFCVAIADLDRFKEVNDRHGHGAGDEVLRRTAGLMRSTLRDVDMIARWGGEEFLILMPRTELEEAKTVLERLRSAVSEQEVVTPAGRLRVTISIGVAQAEEGMSVEMLEDKADHRLYAAKNAGRNQVVAA